MYYEREFCFPKEAFDKKGNIHPFYVLDIFEKSATAHGEILGVGEERMREKNLFWIISGIFYRVFKNPVSGETLIIKTWPLKPKRLTFQREYVIYNKLGEEIIKGSANWLTIDREERKIYTEGDVFPPMEFSSLTCFEGKIPRLRGFLGGNKVLKISPEAKHIDSNGHVNNKHYTTFVSEALGGFEEEIDTFQIEYSSEIMPSDTVDIYVLKEEAHTLIKGESDKHNFTAKIIYR